ncbi:MAG: DUF4391 domain-containing protein [Desulfitobacteriia bacterium]|jgi:hypothetical protein
MFGLPLSTVLNRPLPKKNIYAKFNMSPAHRAKFDEDIRRLAIIGEISPTTTNILAGDNVKSFYIVQVSLRTQDYDLKNIVLLARLIEQNMLFVLEYEGKVRLAVYRAKLLQSEWLPLEELVMRLSGLNLDSVWENLIIQIGGLQIEKGNSLDEQLAIDEERAKLKRKIDQLERQARSEKQPKRKFELVQEVKRLQELAGQ